MHNNSWFKKERPVQGLTGLAGGAAGWLGAGGASNGMDASGGVVNDYEDANSPGTYWRSHMFQLSGAFVVNELSTSADCPNDIDILLVGGGGGGTHGGTATNTSGGSGVVIISYTS